MDEIPPSRFRIPVFEYILRHDFFSPFCNFPIDFLFADFFSCVQSILQNKKQKHIMVRGDFLEKSLTVRGDF